MIIELSIDFTQFEKDIFAELEYDDVDIKLFADTDRLFYSGVRDGEVYHELIENPNRMIGIGGLYLLEVKDELGEWYMGDKQKDNSYHFWGNYDDLKTAIEGL
jgi:hypothetical protein